ncbi:MFS transporter [Micromonospora pisi]|uniref:MFS transporter n=1 Tax=Micromonospora pisi TaxID=589240 RepID=A0A495JL88_9ACTN|nr:MFS transporter [Micromonospora pisi]RKR89766.1 MFS transporter [Micromonospora pisi]
MLQGRSFQKLWGAATLSAFGDSISSTALPLTAILVLDANVVESAILSALIWVPSLLLSVPAGAWVDRSGNRRLVMVAANIGRFVALGSVPLGVALDALSMTQLYTVMFALGACSVLSAVSETGIFAAVIPPDQYVEGQATIHGSHATAMLAGPAAGGYLVQAFSAPLAIMIDAVSALISALLLSRIRIVEVRASATEKVRDSLHSGATFIWRTPFIRTALTVTATVNFFNLMFNAVLMWYFVNHLDMSGGAVGLVLSAQAVGAIVGASFAPRLSAHIGLGRTLLTGCLLFNAPLILVPFVNRADVTGVALLLLAAIGSGYGAATQDISVGSVFALVVPEAMRSRVRGAYQMVSFGIRPLGALAGAAVSTVIGAHSTLLVGAVGGSLAFLWLLPSPLLNFRAPERVLDDA